MKHLPVGFDLRKRAAHEGGFTIIEVTVALMILMVGLVTVAYTATISFNHSARARQKQDATAVANQSIEQVRALAITNLTNGMLTSDLSGDVNISGGKCVNGGGLTLPCNNEDIVSSTSAASDTPLNPHVATISVGPTSFTRKTYLTTVAGSTGSLRITVVVSWPSLSGATNDLIMDSVVDTTSECPAGDLHPYAGPCQSYLSGQGDVPRAAISITPNGAITGYPGFVSDGDTRTDVMQVFAPSVTSAMDMEQVSTVSGGTSTSGLDYLVNNIAPVDADDRPRPCGVVASGSAADTDSPYSSQPSAADDTYCDDATAGADPPGTDLAELMVPPAPAANDTFFVLRKSTGDLPSTARTISTTEATVTNVCDGQTDSLPCAYGQIRQGGQTVALMQAYTGTGDENLGTCPVVQVDNSGSTNSVTYINRDAVTGSSNKVTVTTTRYLPNITLGCIPSNVPRTGSYATWDSASVREFPAGTKRGYLLRFEGWTETVTAEAGVGAASTAPTRSGTIKYWSGSTYTTYPFSTADLSTMGDSSPAGDLPLAETSVLNQTVPAGSRKVCVILTPLVSGTTTTQTTMAIPAVASTATGSPVTSATTTAPAPPVPDVRVHVQSAASNKTCNGGSSPNAAEEVDLLVTTDFGNATAEATYTAGG